MHKHLQWQKCRPLLDEKLDYQGGNHHEQDLFPILLRNLLLVHVLSTNELDQASSDNVQASLHQWMQDIASPIFVPETRNRNRFLNLSDQATVVRQYPFMQKKNNWNRCL
jgi:hypothetical protein